MNVFNKVLLIVENRPLNGHALRNIHNKKTLKSAKVEIEAMLQKDK